MFSRARCIAVRKYLCTAVKATAGKKDVCVPRSISGAMGLLCAVALRALHRISAVLDIEAEESNRGHYFGVYSSKP